MKAQAGVVENLIKQSRALSEETLEKWLFNRLSQFSPFELVAALEGLSTHAAERHTCAEKLLLAFARKDDLMSALGYELLSGTYKIVLHDDNTYLQTVLMRRSPQQEKSGNFNFEPDHMPSNARALESLTLGERREFAKGADLQKLQILVYDTDAIVVRNLLSNARVTEVEILKIASRRGQIPSALTELFTNNKWSKRYSVRKALVFNPSTPRHIALVLTNFMQPQDLKLIVDRDAELPAVVVERARFLRDKANG